MQKTNMKTPKQNGTMIKVREWVKDYELTHKDSKPDNSTFEGSAYLIFKELIDLVGTPKKLETKKTQIPYFAVGNNELEKMPVAGDDATCPGCNKKHKIQNPTITKSSRQELVGTVDKTAGFIHCPKLKKDYLVMLKGKLLFGNRKGGEKE